MKNIHIGKIIATWMATSTTFVSNVVVATTTTTAADAKVVVTDETQHHEQYHSLLRTTMEEVLTTPTTSTSSQNTQKLYQRISSNQQRSTNRTRRHLKNKKKKKNNDNEEEEVMTTESVETLDTGRVEENDGSSTISPSPTTSSLPTTAVPTTAVPTLVPTVSPMSTEEFDTEPLPTFLPTSNPTTSSSTESPSPDVASTMRTLSDSPSPTASFVPTSSSSPTTLDDVEEEDDDENDEIRSRALMTATTKVYITTLSIDERQAMERTIDINNEEGTYYSSSEENKRNTTQIAIDGGYGDNYIVASDLLFDKGSKLLDAVVTTVINMLEEHVVHGTIHYYDDDDNRMLKKKESLKDLRLTYGGISHDVFNIQISGLYWIEIVLPFDVTSSSSDETFISDHKLLELQDEMFNTIKNEIRNGSFIKSLQKQDSRIQDVTTTTTSDDDENSTASSEKVKESNEDYDDEEEKEKNDEEEDVESLSQDEDNSENSTLGAATVGKRTSTDDSKRSPFPPLRIAGLLLLIATITIGAALPVLAKRHRLAKEAESEGDGDGDGNNNNNRTIKKRFTLATNEGVNDFLKCSVRTKLMTDSSNNSSSVSTSRTLKATGRGGGSGGVLLRRPSGRNVKLNDTTNTQNEVGEYDHVTRNHVLEVTGVVTTTNSKDGGRSYCSSSSSNGLDAGSWGSDDDDDDEGSEASFTYGGGGSCMISEFRTAYSEEYDDVPESLMDIHFTDTTTPSGIMDYHMSGPPAPPPSLREQMKRDQDHGGDLVRVLSFP